jgi:hypothetical protein
MSTPSGKPFDPFDLSPYAPKRARERSILARPSFEDDDRQREADHDDADHQHSVADDTAARSSAAEEMPRQFALDLDAGRQPPAPDSADTIGAAPARVEDDGDLMRLQSSVSFLRREAGLAPEKRMGGNDGKRDGEARERLPRVAQLKSISGLGPLDPDGPRPRPEQYINGVRVPPSLAPERLRRPRPLQQRRDYLRGALRVLIAGAIATPIAYYFSVANPATTAEPANGSTLASFAARLVASAEFPLAKEKLRPDEAKAYEAMVASRNKLVAQDNPMPAPAPILAPAHVRTVPVVVPPAAASSPPAAALAPEPAPDQAAVGPAMRALDLETVNLLLQQGEQLVAAGDLVSARQVYRRAAEAGNAAAALALGATFDPAVLAKIGMPGMGADIEKARGWYEKAREFGSADAPHRLETLANR